MKQTALRMVLLVILMVFGGPVYASTGVASEMENSRDMDGRTLQLLCASYLAASFSGKLPGDSTKPFMRCRQYMQGIVEASTFYERMMYTVSGNHVVCFPKKRISTTQAISVTNEYLKKHPEKLDSRGVVLVMEAFYEAYSCNK